MHIVEWWLFVWLFLLSVNAWMFGGAFVVYMIDPNHLEDTTIGEVALAYLIWPVIVAISVIEVLSHEKTENGD